MPKYPVTVTASYDAPQTPRETLDRLRTWAAGRDGRTFVIDDSIAPVRWTATVDYPIEAASEAEAERLAIERFVRETHQAEICSPETVLAATGPLS